MKNQALFSSKDKSKKLKCHLLQFLFGALRVKKISNGLELIHSDPLSCPQKFKCKIHTNNLFSIKHTNVFIAYISYVMHNEDVKT